jgi:hypothetical protein
MIKFILFGIFLILHGLFLLGFNIGGSMIGLITGLCAVISGILFLINR